MERRSDCGGRRGKGAQAGVPCRGCAGRRSGAGARMRGRGEFFSRGARLVTDSVVCVII